MVEGYGCYGCIHYHMERAFESGEQEGYCDLDTNVHKKRFNCFKHERCKGFIDCNIADIYNLIASSYNGITIKEIEKDFSFCNLDKLLGILETEGYIISVKQNGETYYLGV